MPAEDNRRGFSTRIPLVLFLSLLTLIALAACGGQASGDTSLLTEAPPATASVLLTDVPTHVPPALPPKTEAPTRPVPTEPLPTWPVPTEPLPTRPVPTEPAPANQPTQNCTSPAALTPAMTEGPFYKPDSPERTLLLEADTPGTPLFLTGFVLTQDCQPIPNAWLDFWQTDGAGEYDNAGFKMRGHQFTDETGRYSLETVVPGIYPGRTAHIHVKVQAPDGPVLTTQLFFPGVAGNETDSIFSPQLLVALQGEGGQVSGTFDFVVETK